MSYRFLLFDLDGTLLDSQRNIRARSLQVLQGLMARGLGVGFATGRPLRAVRPYTDALRPTGPLVCFNGALVWDLARGEVIAAHNLGRDLAIRALELARTQHVHANLYLGDDIYIERVSDVSQASARKDGVEQIPVGPLDEWLRARTDAPVKVLFIAEPAKLPALAAAVRATQAGAVLVNSEPDYLELLPSGVNKAVGLEALCRHQGIAPDDVIAFGDNLNDRELLARAGLGVAMGNAHADLKAVADVVIGNHDADAIADFLVERFQL